MSTLDVMSGGDYVATLKKTHTKLKRDALNFWEVLAQAIALISPSMTAALIVPLMFGTPPHTTRPTWAFTPPSNAEVR
jgi:hypothetical protein